MGKYSEIGEIIERDIIALTYYTIIEFPDSKEYN